MALFSAHGAGEGGQGVETSLHFKFQITKFTKKSCYTPVSSDEDCLPVLSKIPGTTGPIPTYDG